MISDELFQKLVELDIIPSFRKPTFEELWDKLPKYIIVNVKYRLELFPHAGVTFLSYMSKNPRLSLIDMAGGIKAVTLSDLAAEMLIELKNRGMIE